MLPAAPTLPLDQLQMMRQFFEPMFRKMNEIEEKVDVLLQARGLAVRPAAQPGQPPAEEGEAHAASHAAHWYHGHGHWWSGRSEGHAEAQTSQAST